MGTAKRNAVLAVVVVGLALGGGGCSNGPPEFREPPVRVVATTTLVADLVQRVGGERVIVDTLMGPGVDPHRYQPTAGDRKKLETAHLVFFNGLHLEGKMADLLAKNAGRFRAVAVTAALAPAELLPADGEGGEFDPHVWFNVSLWAKCLTTVTNALAELDAAGRPLYEANAAAYQKELEALDWEIRRELAKVPSAKRKLVTSHDAFRYFGAAYHYEVRGLQGVSTASETSTKDRIELAKYLSEHRIPAVFTETSVPDEGLRAVLDTCQRDYGHTVQLIGGSTALFSDALGPPETPAGTYCGMIRHNVQVIVTALGN
ncbi:MAG: zinc ABC transporter substrate-binding protein [Gemmataceae bacterium]|nr:zinc ABC transporter substrate-binding protein [Gemmata sp.]MDW8197960.1 zinc ABC transporter substrate-binding protein [Gemmataceae bacterium]